MELNGPANLALRTVVPGLQYQLLKRGRVVMDACFCAVENCWLWATGRETEQLTNLERRQARQLVRRAARAGV
jgi:hypothetical protein